jgi:uncharacterized protein (DUF302 family)
MNETTSTQLGLTVRLDTDFASAQDRTIDALKAEGFGVLTEIDVKETLQKKLGVDFRPYKILGACNPTLAHRALEIAPEVGLLLPCNVTLSQVGEGIVEVSIIDPRMMLSVVANADLKPVAEEARARLARVAAALQEK